MGVALATEDGWAASDVGEWFALVSVGAWVEDSIVLGRVRQLREWVDVIAGPGPGKYVKGVLPNGVWVARGDQIVGLAETAGDFQSNGGEDSQESHSDRPAGVVEVGADTEGTIYLRADPASPPYVSAGDYVEPKATLALIEVMKTFTPVRAPQSAEIVKVLVTDGAAVECNQILFWIRPGK